MKCFSYDHLDSTSLKATELLRQGEQAPFAVVATQQSAGKGRRGRDWQSPAGGLYISFVLKPLQQDIQKMGTHSLVAALLTSQFLQEHCHVQTRIKWPNDLLYRGAKLVGILGEYVEYDATGYLVLGIGVNVNTDVSLHAQERPSTSLQAILGESLDLDALTQNFLKFWEEAWSRFDLVHLEKNFQQHPQVDFWQQEDQIYHAQGVDAQGALQVYDSGELRSFYSADHQLTPLLGREARQHFLWLEIGNSRVKLAYIEADKFKVQYFDRQTPAWEQSFYECVNQLYPRYQAMYYATVDTEFSQQLLAPLQDKVVKKIRKSYQYVRSKYPLAQIGMDRLLLIEGAATTYKDTAAVLVVSVGTAMTLDLVIKNEHKGGYIVPGWNLSLQTLSHLAELPDLSSQAAQDAVCDIGQNTQTAMVSGVLWQAQAFIQQTCRMMLDKWSVDSVQVVLTGGGAPALQPLLPDAIYDEQLLWEAMACKALD